MAELTEMMKRPKDMTGRELAALPVKSQFFPSLQPDGSWKRPRLSPYGLGGDDLLDYWQDADGQWWREPSDF